MITDPGEPHGITATQAHAAWEEFRQFPETEQVIYPDTELYRILLAYSDLDDGYLSRYSPNVLGQLFADHCEPGLILETPRPAWAKDTSNEPPTAHHAACWHSADLVACGPVKVAVQRRDVWDIATRALTIGEAIATIDSEGENPVTPHQLRAIADTLTKAADQLDQIRVSASEPTEQQTLKEK